MINTRFIKIIILIAIPLLLIFAFIFIKNNNTASNPQNTNSTSTLTGINGRPVLNTNLSNPTGQEDLTNTPTGSYSNTNINPADYTNSGPEDILRKKIEKILFDWSITKDEASLRTAVSLSENIDNEVVLSAWAPFMKTDSSELVKIINTSTDIQKTKKTVRSIFQWYIDLSGEYEKLSPTKKQQLTSQYNQMK